MSSDLTSDFVPTYAVVDKKAKARRKAPQKPPQQQQHQPDPAMEMYATVDMSKKKSRSSEKLVTDSMDEAPTYDMIESGFTKAVPPPGTHDPAPTYSSIDRSNVPPSKTPVKPQVALPAKKDASPKKDDLPKKGFSRIVVASVILVIILSVILAGLVIALIMAFVEIVNLQSMLNAVKTSTSSQVSTMPTAASTSATPTNSALISTNNELEANFTMLQENFEMLKVTVNAMFENLTNETMTDINERRRMLDAIAPTLLSIRSTLENEIPGNLTDIENDANMRLDDIAMNVTSTLMALRQNFTARISNINTEAQARLENIQLVANETLLRGQSA